MQENRHSPELLMEYNIFFEKASSMSHNFEMYMSFN